MTKVILKSTLATIGTLFLLYGYFQLCLKYPMSILIILGVFLIILIFHGFFKLFKGKNLK
jgi:uncharacterized membrane protein